METPSRLSSSGAPILVTGIARSGTTWVGRMLHAGGRTTYVDEPLNIWRSPRAARERTRDWPGYPYATAASDERVLPVVRDLVRLRAGTLRELRGARSRADVRSVLSTAAAFASGRVRRRRALIKEPHAVFLASWFVDRVGGHAVVTARHPGAVVSSWKRLGWPVDFDQLLCQPRLVHDLLQPYEEAMRRLRGSDDVVAQVALLWTVIHDCVARLERHSRLLIVRHEDLSTRPLDEFRRLYDVLGLPYSAAVEADLLASTSAQNPSETGVDDPHAVRLDSRANLGNWKNRLTAAEIERVREITGDVARRFYADAEWA